jgi:hypothetical protein
VNYRQFLLDCNYPKKVVDAMTDEECEGEYEVIISGYVTEGEAN